MRIKPATEFKEAKVGIASSMVIQCPEGPEIFM